MRIFSHAKCERNPETWEDCVFHGLQKQLRDLMWYLDDDLRVIYPKLMTAANKAESEYEDRLKEGSRVKSVQAEGENEIITLTEKIIHLQVVIQKPSVRTKSDHPRQLGNRNSENRNVSTTMGNGTGQNCHKRHDCSKVKCFWCEGWGHLVQVYSSTPLSKNQGEVANTSNLPPGIYNWVEENQECQ